MRRDQRLQISGEAVNRIAQKTGQWGDEYYYEGYTEVDQADKAVDRIAKRLEIKEAAGDAAAVTLSYGKFIQTVVDFLIISFAIFIAIKGMNALKKKEEAAPAEPPPPSKEEILLTEIRDAIRQK